MSLFDSYERECEHSLNEATKKIAALGTTSGAAKDRISREIEDELARAQRSIDSMRQMSQNARASEGYGSRIAQKESAVGRVKTDFERSLNPGKGREDLFAGSSARQSDWDRQDRLLRDGMNGNRQILDRTTDHLAGAHQLAEESHQIGVNTLNDLRAQREQLLNAQGGMNNIEEKTGTARRVLGMMRRRVIGNKLILGFIIFILLVANALIIYFRWGYKKKVSSPAPPPVRPAPVPVPVPVPVAAPITVPIAAPVMPPIAPVATPIAPVTAPPAPVARFAASFASDDSVNRLAYGVDQK